MKYNPDEVINALAAQVAALTAENAKLRSALTAAAQPQDTAKEAVTG